MFTNRVAADWNKLCKYIVEQNTIDSLKWRLDKYMGGVEKW